MAAGKLESPAGSGEADQKPHDDLKPLQPVLRIGVTGHRDVADPAGAREMVAVTLSQLLGMLESARLPVGIFGSAAPGADTIGYRVISPLAEGADRIVADLVPSRRAGQSGRTRELVVPLPFQKDCYRGTAERPGTDCTTPQSQAEFDKLAKRAWWVRPLHSEAPKDKKQRNAWYRDVGEYVAGHCDVLFALWDGVDNEEPDGTADIVRFALRRGTPVLWIPVTRITQPRGAASLPSDAGPRLLPVPHASGKDPDAASNVQVDLAATRNAGVDLAMPPARTVLLGHKRSRSSVQKLLVERLAGLEDLDRYARSSEQARHDIKKERQAAVAVDPGRQMLADVADWIVPAYAITDGLARRYQVRLKTLNISVYAAAAVAVALGALAAIMFPYGGPWRLLVIVEAVVLASLLAIQGLELRKKCRDRWVAFRTMSEYLRIGRYLALLTPRTDTALEFQHFARLYSWSSEPGLTPWFGPAVEHIWEHRPVLGENSDSDDVKRLQHNLISDWIGSQIEYHKKKRDSHHLWDRIFRWAIQVTLFATLLIVVLHVLQDYFPAFLGTSATGRHHLLVTLEFLAIALTSVAAALTGYAGLQRHSFHYARFGRMAIELSRIKDEMGGASGAAELRNHVSDVRRVTLGETTNWFEDMQGQVMESPA